MDYQLDVKEKTMEKGTFIQVSGTGLNQPPVQYIENNPEKISKAAQDGLIQNSIIEFLYPPKTAREAPPQNGDLFIEAYCVKYPPLAIGAMRKAIGDICDYYAELNPKMLRYYMNDRGVVYVMIPRGLFGGDFFTPHLRYFYSRFTNELLSHVELDKELSLLNPDTNISATMQSLTTRNLIGVCFYLCSRDIPKWIPPENSTAKEFTIEIDYDTFFNEPIDEVWKMVSNRHHFHPEPLAPVGKPLEKAYNKILSGLSCPNADLLQKRINSLSGCKVYNLILDKVESLNNEQRKLVIEMLSSLGDYGLDKAIEIFTKDDVMTEGEIKRIFSDITFNRRFVTCEALSRAFDCGEGLCNVVCPHELEPPMPVDNEPRRIKLYENGLYYSPRAFSPAGDDVMHISSPLVLVGKTSNSDSQEWAFEVIVVAPNGQKTRLRIPYEYLEGSNKDKLKSLLARHGFETYRPGVWPKIVEYIKFDTPKKCMMTTNTLGWQNDFYVLPDETIGHDDIRIAYNNIPGMFQVSGTLTEWFNDIGSFCSGNPLLVFVCCYALTGVLLTPCEIPEGGGIHLYGPSSIGKTTVALVAGSVCGGTKGKGFLLQWRTTSNALEVVASRHNDNLLCLDEVGEATAETVSQISYMISNGQGKSRMKTDGTERKTWRWKLSLLSTGELGISDKIEETGKLKSRAGQGVRMIDIPIGSDGSGPFVDLHGLPNPADFSNYLKNKAVTLFGTPLRAFVRSLCGNTGKEFSENIELINGLRDEFVKAHRPVDCGGQVMRVLDRFALIAGAGIFAVRNGVFPWSEAEVLAAVAGEFDKWIKSRGTTGNLEIERAIESLVEWYENNYGELLDLETCSYWEKDYSYKYKGFIWKDNNEDIVLIKTREIPQAIKRVNRTELLNELKKRNMLALTSKGTPKLFRSIKNANCRGLILRKAALLVDVDPEDKIDIQPMQVKDHYVSDPDCEF